MTEEFSHYWQTIIETMQDGLMVVDPAGTIVTVNPMLEELTGFNQEELVGHPCTILGCDMCAGVKDQVADDQYCALFSQGGIRGCRCTMRHKDGTPVPVLKKAALLHDDDGAVVGGVETLTDLREVVSKEKVIDGIRRELGLEQSFAGILGRSHPMRELFQLIASAADSLAPVLILGESGTGKELVANAIHSLGPRSSAPWVKVNCAALNQSLLESELFGHVKGAFTGADRNRVGRFQAAHTGDLFLDEIGELPPTTQVKLLRVLQEKVIEPVGDHRPIAVDVRFIAATNQDLSHLVAQGKFREDLYYRVAVVPIQVPPLRARKDDIPLLVETFVQRISSLSGKPAPPVRAEAMETMLAHDWPGNVRELINVVEYALVMGRGGEIKRSHLPKELSGAAGSPVRAPAPAPSPASEASSEAQRILAALQQAGGKREEAARLLGISRVTLWKRMKKHGIEANRFAG